MKTIKDILLSNTLKRFYWNTLAGFLAVLAVVLTDTNWVYAPVIAAVINGITKEINKRYL